MEEKEKYFQKLSLEAGEHYQLKLLEEILWQLRIANK